ncbi:hypothetical protein GIB67_026322 [Kingdonia uniflora]|uniref:Aminotransferase-like plant mobile domain-containing protein n=1 Tax=Kingdonia uniflora TaxID=39325 RepID=A0A7J7N627_9MAGN|nr:hypothetical protein GIB67_026322 [Kingdonia uniflora]
MPNRDEIQCRGSLDKVLKWYQWIVVYPTLKKLVDDLGFEEFCSIKTGNSDNRLIHALVERWWPSIHIFHFPCEELGFTPLDFVMLTGISFGRGRELPYDERYSKLEEVKKIFPGITRSDIRYGNITLAYLKKWKEPLNLRLNNYDPQMDIVYARAFIAYMMGNLFFSNGRTYFQAGYLAALTDYDIIGDRCMGQMTEHDSVPYDPPQEIMEFPRYDRELYQGLKDMNFYDGRNYLVSDVDYMTYWRAVYPNPKINYNLVKKAENIWMVGRNPVRLDVYLPPTSSLATSSQVQDYDVHATDDPHDMGLSMDVAGTSDQRRRIQIPVMQRNEQKKEEKEARARARDEQKLAREAEIQMRREAELAQKKTIEDTHMVKVMTTDPSNLLPAQRCWMKKQIKEYSKKLKEQRPSDDDVSNDED